MISIRFYGSAVYNKKYNISVLKCEAECWNDVETQEGFNYIFNESFEEFCDFNIDEYRLWATIILKEKRYPIYCSPMF